MGRDLHSNWWATAVSNVLWTTYLQLQNKVHKGQEWSGELSLGPKNF